jgi:cytochrome P450
MPAQPSALDWRVPAHVPSELVVPFDFMRGEYVHAFPPEAIDTFRDRPVLYSPLFGGFWLLTTYADIKRVFQDSERFRQSPSGTIPAVQLPSPLIPSTLDGPDHHHWRQLLVPLFSPRRARETEDLLRGYCRQTLAGLAGQDHCEIIRDFAQGLPVVRFCSQFGFTRDEGNTLLRLGDDLIYGSERVIVAEGVEAGTRHRAAVMARVNSLMAAVLDARRRAPGGDVVSELIDLQFEGAPVTDADLLNIMGLFFFAGSDSSSGAIAYAMLHFATHPDERAEFTRNPSSRDGHVEELLRLGAVHYIARRVAMDTEFEGVLMKEGDMVALPTLAANRDPDAYPDASRLDLERSAPAHMTFGLGRHRCIGLHQARFELRVALEEFHAAIPEYSLDPAAPLEYIAGVRSRPRAVNLVFPSRAP